MNTPAHLIFGTAAFGQPGRVRVTTAAALGSLAPDASLYLMFFWCRWVMDIPAQRIFRELYYSDAWMTVFAIDNSFILWGVGLALALWRGWTAAAAFAAAGLLHLALDFPLHNDDARPMFWPLTDARFISPVSYWDNAHYAGLVGPVAGILAIAVALWAAARFRTLAVRAGFAILAAAELTASGIWRFVF